jgi:hypothetical protein
MEYDKLKRINMNTKRIDLVNLKDAIQSIVDDMEDGGFKLQDAKDYIQVLVNEVLGDQ